MDNQENNIELNNAEENDTTIDDFVLLEDQVEDKEFKVDLDSLPPGYGFFPTDEELLTIYLKKKVLNMPLPLNKIREQNIYDYSPMEIFDRYNEQEEATMYFFTPRERKYLNGDRPNRATRDIGFWKASGTAYDVKGKGKITIGQRRSLVYYLRGQIKPTKTDWLMNEFTLIDNTTSRKSRNPPTPRDMELDKWVLCKVYKKKKNGAQEGESDDEVASTNSDPVSYEIHDDPQTMQIINRNVPAQLSTTMLPSHAMRHASSSQMPNYRSHVTCPTSLSQMPNYHSYAMCLGSSSQMPNCHSRASSSRMPFYNNDNSGQNGFSMHQHLPETMQIADFNMPAQQGPTTPASNSRTSSSQMSSYCHNGQNGFPVPQDHLVRLEVLPWQSNPPENNNERDDMMNVPDTPMDWLQFLSLDQEDFEPLDIGELPSDLRSNDDKKPRRGGS